MKNEYAPKRREGAVVNVFKKGDKADPGNYRGITLLRTVGKTFSDILNDRLGTMTDLGARKKMRRANGGLGQTEVA